VASVKPDEAAAAPKEPPSVSIDVEASAEEGSDAPLPNFADFLYLAHVRFLDKVTSKRRTTMLLPPSRMVGEIAGAVSVSSVARTGCVILPELETLQWGCNYLVATT